MALTSSKFVTEGPATVVLKDSTTAKVTVTSINPENAKFTAEETVNEKERADGSKAYTRMGKRCALEIAYDELSPADLDLLATVDNLTCAFANTGKTITISGLELVTPNVSDGKTVILARKSAAAGTTWASLFSVA
jgi:hypothetical protein